MLVKEPIEVRLNKLLFACEIKFYGFSLTMPANIKSSRSNNELEQLHGTFTVRSSQQASCVGKKIVHEAIIVFINVQREDNHRKQFKPRLIIGRLRSTVQAA